MPFSTYPASSHLRRMVLSIGMLTSNHSFEMLSKHPVMSASNTQVAELGLFRALKAACTASAHDLPSRKP